MTNLDSVLRGKNITLPTKVSIVKAMVFPVVTHGCESWRIAVLEKTLKSAIDSKKIKPVNPKGNPWKDGC